MTVLEELVEAAFRACDMGHAQGQQRVTGAALLTRSGKMLVSDYCNALYFILVSGLYVSSDSISMKFNG